MKKLFILLLLSITPNVFSDGLPELGDVSQNVLNPLQERQIGRQSMLQIRSTKQFLQDAEINDYLNQLGSRLVENSSEPGLNFEFFGINDNSVNAFALPGGFIGINTGLVLISQSESELAAVLCHEIAHVTQHHLARMLAGQQNNTLTSFAALAIAILAARNNSQVSQAAITGMQAHNIQSQLNFTRTHEQEADRIGLEILQKSGFNGHAMPEFLERLQRATRLLESNAPSYLRTHPITSERISDVENRLMQQPYKLTADSLNFQLVRSKLLAEQKTPAEAVSFFQAALDKQKYGNPIAQRYGLVYALLKQGKTAQAEQELSILQKQASSNAMIETLAGQVMLAKGKNKEAVAFYQNAVQNFPRHRALIYDYLELLLQTQQAEAAIKLLSEQVLRYPSDAHFYEQQARAYSMLNKRFEQHYAQANALASQGRLQAAIEQLELAKQQGASFYQLSTVDSDLRELREILAPNQKK